MGSYEGDHALKGSLYYVLCEGRSQPDLVIAKQTNSDTFYLHPAREAQGIALQHLIGSRTYEVYGDGEFEFLSPVPGDNLMDIRRSLAEPWPTLNWALGCVLAESLTFLVHDVTRNTIVDAQRLRTFAVPRLPCRTSALPICRVDLATSWAAQTERHRQSDIEEAARLVELFHADLRGEINGSRNILASKWTCDEHGRQTIIDESPHPLLIEGALTRFRDIRDIYQSDKAAFRAGLAEHLVPDQAERVIERIERFGDRQEAGFFIRAGHMEYLPYYREAPLDDFDFF